MSVKKIVALAALLLVSTLLSLIVAEVIARLLFPFPEKHEKHWMLSSPTFRIDSNGAVRYVTSETIRSVIVQDDGVVYDVRFQTNDLGFIDHEDYAARAARSGDAPRYAFVGDSFTAGFHGGTPWVPALRDEARKTQPNLEIFNLGVSGTGFAHFARLLRSFSSEAEFSDIVILAISYDFWRPFWTPLLRDRALRFCGEEETVELCPELTRPVAHVFDGEPSQFEIVALARGLDEGAAAAPSTARDRVLTHSRLASLLFEQYLGFKLKLSRQQALDRLAELRLAFPDQSIRFIHLPSMNELARGNYDLSLEGHIADLGIEYFPAMTACSWPNGMFYTADGHPNATGYEAISRCVSDYLKLR